MACICGCDEDDHLHSLPSGPASPNTFFENFWAPTFVEVLTYRLQTVLYESEPSKRILWRQEYGGDAQDTVHPFHKWANPPTVSDESPGCGIPTPTLPTPNFEEIMKEEQMVQEELMHDQHRTSGHSWVAQKRPSPSNEEHHPQWTHALARDVHDTASPRLQWAKPPTVLDESRGCGLCISRLLTPDSEVIMRKKELSKDWRRTSGVPARAARRRSPTNEEEDPQISLPPAKGVTCNSSFWSEESITNPSSPNDVNQSVPDSSIKLASHNLPFWYDHGDTVSCTPPVHRHHDDPGDEFAAELFQYRSPASQASRCSPWIIQDARGSTKRKAETADLEDRVKTQKGFSSTSTPNRYPCGYSEGTVHCLWLNVPPPPNTFFENTLAPKFTYILDTRLDHAATRFEASRQAWWRPECGGCAPDRKRLVSEISTEKSDGWGNVLEIGPLPFDDVSKIRSRTRSQSSRNRQRSTRSLSAPIRSLDGLASALTQDFIYGHNNAPKSFPFYEPSKRCKRWNEKNAENWNHADDPDRPFFRAPTVARNAKPSNSPTESVFDGVPLKAPHFSQKRSPWLKKKDLIVEKCQQLRQSCMQKLEPMKLKRHRQVEVPLKRGRPLFAENPSLTFQGDNIKKAPSSIKAMKEESCTDEPQDWDQSTSPELEAIFLRRNSWHGTASDRHDSLDTVFSPSTSQDLHAEEIPPNVEDLTNDFAQDQRRQSLSQKIEALKMRRSRRQGIALYRHGDPAVETSSSALHVDHVEEIPWIERKESMTDRTQRLQQSSEETF